jgi:hypothetical protein
MNKIYCFVNGGSPYFLNVLALADDGHVLAGHASSSEYWAMHDIGVNSDWKHNLYKEHFPNGYELVWLDNPMEDEGFKCAAKLNEKLGEEAESK